MPLLSDLLQHTHTPAVNVCLMTKCNYKHYTVTEMLSASVYIKMEVEIKISMFTLSKESYTDCHNIFISLIAVDDLCKCITSLLHNVHSSVAMH